MYLHILYWRRYGNRTKFYISRYWQIVTNETARNTNQSFSEWCPSISQSVGPSVCLWTRVQLKSFNGFLWDFGFRFIIWVDHRLINFCYRYVNRKWQFTDDILIFLKIFYHLFTYENCSKHDDLPLLSEKYFCCGHLKADKIGFLLIIWLQEEN